MAEDIGASMYVECSALTNKGVQNVFDKVIEAWLFPLSKKKTRK